MVLAGPDTIHKRKMVQEGIRVSQGTERTTAERRRLAFEVRLAWTSVDPLERTEYIQQGNPAFFLY